MHELKWISLLLRSQFLHLVHAFLSTFHEWVPVFSVPAATSVQGAFPIFSHIRGSINSVRSSSNWQQQQHSQAIVKPLPQKRSLHRDGLTQHPAREPRIHDKTGRRPGENRRFYATPVQRIAVTLCLFSFRFICQWGGASPRPRCSDMNIMIYQKSTPAYP